ncbi:MAG: hypothetical protein JNK82_00180 [Myxococcaceae bacterium]|nr:hypothetical protein [Myxococcaceae bacterium]
MKLSVATDSALVAWISYEPPGLQAVVHAVLSHGDGGTFDAVLSPALENSRLRVGATLTSDGLAAVVWLDGLNLDGDRVILSRYSSGVWSSPETISAPPSGPLAVVSDLFINRSATSAWWAESTSDTRIVRADFDGGNWTRSVVDEAAPTQVSTPNLVVVEGPAGSTLAAFVQHPGELTVMSQGNRPGRDTFTGFLHHQPPQLAVHSDGTRWFATHSSPTARFLVTHCP